MFIIIYFYSGLSGEREPRHTIFKIFISNLSLSSRFSFEIVLSEKQSKL